MAIMQNVAIVMAAGQGSRMKDTLPKQFMDINGKMLIEYSLETFQKHPLIDAIVVVLPDKCPKEIKKALKANYPKISEFVSGGKERFLSSWAAVKLFKKRPQDNLLLHDAARPCVTEKIINNITQQLNEYQAIVTALPATDTILQITNSQSVSGVLDRSNLYYAQTPQAFRAGLLYEVFTQLLDDKDFTPTDETGVVTHYRPDISIKIVLGDPDNFKVTYPSDIERVKQILSPRL